MQQKIEKMRDALNRRKRANF